jgi:short-subunit dehydrogenase
MSFADRYGPWALITGASEGTGRSFARQLAADGVPSILVARRAEPLAALVEEIRAESGVECVTATIDLAAPDALDRIAAAVGRRDVGLLVCNAGADPNGSRFLDRDLAVWNELVQRNVVTTMQCCHHFAALMKQRRRGGLLLVNSGACYGGASFMSAYAASKAFMLCFAEALWAELRPHGIDVLTLVMGQTDTPAFRALLAEKGLPFPPNTASPDDVAKVGLERLAQGPIHNWGFDEDVAGFAPNSAKARRERVLMIDSMTKPIFGDS